MLCCLGDNEKGGEEEEEEEEDQEEEEEREPGVVVHTCELGRLKQEDHKFEASLGYKVPGQPGYKVSKKKKVSIYSVYLQIFPEYFQSTCD